MAKAAFVAGPEDAGRLLSEGDCLGVGMDERGRVLEFERSPLMVNA